MQKQTWGTTLDSLPALYEQDDAVTSGIRPPPAPPEADESISGEYDMPSLDPVVEAGAEPSLDEPSYDPPQEDLPAIDRRVFDRQPLDATIKLTINGVHVDADGVDIGRGGLQCQPLPHWTRRGDPVLVSLPAPHRQVLGRVAWVRPVSVAEDEKVIGIRFSSPLPFLH